jgi:hypothetical protein
MGIKNEINTGRQQLLEFKGRKKKWNGIGYFRDLTDGDGKLYRQWMWFKVIVMECTLWPI